MNPYTYLPKVGSQWVDTSLERAVCLDLFPIHTLWVDGECGMRLASQSF